MSSENVVWACSSCGQKNRIHLHRFQEEPKCGACGELLDIGSPQAVDSRSFEQVVIHSPMPILVDFWAPWCGPCRVIAPVLEEMAKRFQGRLLIVKVNTDDNPALAAQFQIQGIPALLLFRDGELLDRLAGALPAAQLEKWLSAHL